MEKTEYELERASAVQQFNTIIEIGNFLQPLFALKVTDLAFRHALKAALIDRTYCDEKTLNILKANLFDGHVKAFGQPITMNEFEEDLTGYFDVITDLILINFDNFFLQWEKEANERNALEKEKEAQDMVQELTGLLDQTPMN